MVHKTQQAFFGGQFEERERVEREENEYKNWESS